MLDREFVLRFLTFYELGVLEYKGSIDLFLNSGMDYINKVYEDSYGSDMRKLFIIVLKTSMNIFGKFAFRRMPDLDKRRPISKALFETWTSILARYSREDLYALERKREVIIEKYRIMCSDDEEFIESIGSGKISSVKKRFEKIGGLIEEVIKL